MIMPHGCASSSSRPCRAPEASEVIHRVHPVSRTGNQEIQQTPDRKGGTQAPWYSGWDLSDERRAYFRERSRKSHAAKLRALSDERIEPVHPINTPTLDPAMLMPQMDENGIASLSLFSGGGGLDLGFDRAGYAHMVSFDTLEAAGRTLLANRPDWDVRCGVEGDVRGGLARLAWSRRCRPWRTPVRAVLGCGTSKGTRR